MPDTTRGAEKILSGLKGLRDHLQPDEQPVLTQPAIWDNGQGTDSTPCDVVVTNQRLLGYYFVSFPRERLFLDAIDLSTITHITLRQKTNSPIFQEILVSDGKRKIYVRAPRKKIEALYTALRSATGQAPAGAADEGQIAHTPAPSTAASASESSPDTPSNAPPDTSSNVSSSEQSGAAPAPIYGRQDIRTPFESSPLAIALLFGGGLALEVIGGMLWALTNNPQVGFPLCLAGLIAVGTGLLTIRQRRNK